MGGGGGGGGVVVAVLGGGCRAGRAFAVQSFLIVSSLTVRGLGRVLGR